jgi:hypothetical protein
MTLPEQTDSEQLLDVWQDGYAAGCKRVGTGSPEAWRRLVRRYRQLLGAYVVLAVGWIADTLHQLGVW